MGRKKSGSIQRSHKKEASAAKENYKLRKELSLLINKLLSLTSQFQIKVSIKTALKDYHEIYSLLTQILAIESTLQKKIKVDNRQSNIDKFVSWMKENGASFEGIEICEFEGYDLGLKAKKEFTGGSPLLTVPRKVMMTEVEANESELGDVIKLDTLLQTMPNITLALFLLLEKTNPDSFWKPFINVLPEKYNTILYFTPEELLELKPSPVLEQALMLYRSIARQYAYFYNKIFNMDLPAMIKLREIFSFDSYRWAVSTVMTRQNNLQLSNKKATAFIPLWDMCNHEQGKITTDFNAMKEQGECFALRDFKEGEQIFIYYGERSNAGLFLHNGFVYPDNKEDSMRIAFGVSSNDPDRELKMEVLSKMGLGDTTHYSIYDTRIPIDPLLMLFTTIFLMPSEALKYTSLQKIPKALTSFDVNSVMDPKMNKPAYQYLLTRLSLIRDLYKTTGLAKNDAIEMSYKLRNVHLLKECEMKILDRAIKYLQAQIKEILAIENEPQNIENPLIMA